MTNQSSAHKNIIYSTGFIVLVALSWGFFVLGAKPLNIFDRSWLWHDLAQVYLAWAQYTSDSNANWLMSNRMSYPIEMNFALFDPMPIFLLTFGKLSPLLPDQTQYFGVYFVICLILQGIFGYLILKNITSHSISNNIYQELYCVIGAIFFIVCPYTFYRFQQHIALASHWIILLSIWAILGTRKANPTLWVLLNCLVVILASGLNPYLTLMVFISQVFIVYFDFYKESYPQIVCRITSLCIAAVIGLKTFGFLSASGARDFGYGVFSMNMLGIFSSNGWATILPLNIPDATGGQAWEGFNYLGLGTLSLTCFSVFFYLYRKSNTFSTFPYRAALGTILISYFLALSTTITFSSFVIKPFIPSIFVHFLSAFRASGRFFWVGGYWLLLIGIATLPLYVNLKRASYLLIFFLGIQIIDVSGVANTIRNVINTTLRTSIRSDDISLNTQNFNTLMILPPWQCDTEKTAGSGNNYEYLGFYAADHRLHTNNFYAARTLPDQIKAHCAINVEDIKFDSDKLYILSKEYYSKLNISHLNKLKCVFNSDHHFHVCNVGRE